MSEAFGKKEEELHQLLTIYKESWRDDYRFFSARDLELAVNGLCDRAYEMVELEVGKDTLQAVLDEEKAPDITLRLFIQKDSGICAMERTTDRHQAESFLRRMSEGGTPKELNGWKDVTDTIEA